jgi:hypothetical protein
MTYRLRAAFYVFMMLLVSAVIVGVYFDRPREAPMGADAPAAAADGNTYVPQPADGPVTDAKPEVTNQA